MGQIAAIPGNWTHKAGDNRHLKQICHFFGMCILSAPTARPPEAQEVLKRAGAHPK
jgi:hypothetical protein